MRAYEVRDATDDYEGLIQVERDRPTPAANEALVRIHAASLNYRDLAIANSDLAYPGTDLPVVPLSDGAGEITEVGDAVTSLSVGDRVATPFFPDWIDGRGTPERLARSTGGTVNGALAEYATFRADSIPVLPEHCSYEDGATLPCAGLTAWRSLAEDGNLSAGETVLALGTGGVSTFGLQFARLHGARTIVTSSSDEKLAHAREMGAWETINYEADPDWHERVGELTDREGVDHVIEVGGQGTLERSLGAVRTGGHVHLIGVLTGQDGAVDPGLVLGKSIKLEGVSVGSTAMANRMNRAIEVAGMEPVVDRAFGFDEAREAYRYLESGAHQGNVVVSID